MVAAAVILQQDNAVARPVASLSRAEVLTRYRHFREISKQHHSAVLNFLPKDTVISHARRIGLAQGKTLVLDSMDEVRFRAPKDKGKAELVDGKVGKAVRFSFDKDARSAFFIGNLRGKPEWDRAAGFSFWVKGDGSDSFAGLELIHDDDFAVRYDYCFPIKATEWTKVTVAWRDLVPVLPGPKSKPLGAGFITGGGYLTMQSSSGLYPGAPGTTEKTQSSPLVVQFQLRPNALAH